MTWCVWTRTPASDERKRNFDPKDEKLNAMPRLLLGECGDYELARRVERKYGRDMRHPDVPYLYTCAETLEDMVDALNACYPIGLEFKLQDVAHLLAEVAAHGEFFMEADDGVGQD